jgi:hypothetical protein
MREAVKEPRLVMKVAVGTFPILSIAAARQPIRRTPMWVIAVGGRSF